MVVVGRARSARPRISGPRSRSNGARASSRRQPLELAAPRSARAAQIVLRERKAGVRAARSAAPARRRRPRTSCAAPRAGATSSSSARRSAAASSAPSSAHADGMWYARLAPARAAPGTTALLRERQRRSRSLAIDRQRSPAAPPRAAQRLDRVGEARRASGARTASRQRQLDAAAPGARATSTRIASSEWPPSSKKLSCAPDPLDARARRARSPRARSRARRRGASYARAAYASPSGAGSALRSSLPLGVSGSASSCTNAAGTMYSGSSASRCARSASTPISAAALGRVVRDQALLAGVVLARDDRPPRAPPACSRQRAPRSRPARCGSRESSPGSRCGPRTRCRRRADSAPDRPSGTAGRPSTNGLRDEPLRRQLRPVQIAARRPHAADVQLARHARPAPARSCASSDVHARVRDRPADRDVRRQVRSGTRPPRRRRPPLRSGRTNSTAAPAAAVRRTAAPRDSGSASPLQITSASVVHAAASACSRKNCSIEGTKCSVVMPCSRTDARRGSRGPCDRPGRAITKRAPLSSGQNNSHTDTSKLNGVFCSTASAALEPVGFLHPQQAVDHARGARSSRLWAGRWSPRCRSRTPSCAASSPARSGSCAASCDQRSASATTSSTATRSPQQLVHRVGNRRRA